MFCARITNLGVLNDPQLFLETRIKKKTADAWVRSGTAQIACANLNCRHYFAYMPNIRATTCGFSSKFISDLKLPNLTHELCIFTK